MERWLGAAAGAAVAAVAFILVRAWWGWAAFALMACMGGWSLGAYVRNLIRISERDPLTGLRNRRPFERTVEVEWRRAIRYGRPLSLLFIEVDDFGLVNKRYGHLMGDEVLKALSWELQCSIRSMDVLARWGGDEFVILLPETSKSNALILAERIRKVVEVCVVRDRNSTVGVTISTGISSGPEQFRHAEDMLRQAIEGQRKAKIHKNTVEWVS